MAISQDEARVIYKLKNSREEFFVYVDPEEVLNWRKDKSIPLTSVVQNFDVFETVNGGNEGIAGRPSKQRLENAFDTSNITDVIEYILQHGNIHHSRKGLSKGGDLSNEKNESRGKGISGTAVGVHN
ncbi:ribosome maturation protein [Glomus cerebriforme]|uniref:Ribosome maturation protein n=1 Tax=Glomus cerebriforme TaxID=658196 RepID=A0A397TAI7_9GLOM|nr:ribosome maturation protein [Glomus cerebriforme]